MDWLNSREIAILIWLGVLLAAASLNAGARSAMGNVMRAFFQWRVQIVIGLLVAYTALIVWALASLSPWDLSQFKNTIVWLVAVGIATLLRLPHVREDTRFFQEWASDNLKLIAIVEFVVTFFTFDLWLELLIQPFLFLVLGMLAFAPKEPRYELTTKLLNGILVAFGLAMVVYAASRLVADFKSFATWTTFQDFYVPIVLSLAALPFFFAVHVYMTYERVFSTLQFKIKDPALRRRAQLGALLAFGPRAGLVERWNRYIGAHRPTSVDDLRQAIRDVKNAKRRELHATKVPPERGWSPALARSFLTSEGLRAGDYHRLYDEWLASSSYLELGDGVLGNNIAYYLKGDELVVTELKLILNINEPATATHAQQVFFTKAAILLKAALPTNDIELGPVPFDLEVSHWRVSLHRQDWQGGIRGGYELVLTIDVPGENASAETLPLAVAATQP